VGRRGKSYDGARSSKIIQYSLLVQPPANWRPAEMAKLQAFLLLLTALVLLTLMLASLLVLLFKKTKSNPLDWNLFQ
jgi:hypothetical protein